MRGSPGCRGDDPAARRILELDDALSPIYVTLPTLPSLSDLLPHLQGIRDRRIMSNGGPLHQQLVTTLAANLGVPHVSPFANATLELIVALKVLDLRGDLVASPCSLVASAHALNWAGCESVLADIGPVTLNRDPTAIGHIHRRTERLHPAYPLQSERLRRWCRQRACTNPRTSGRVRRRACIRRGSRRSQSAGVRGPVGGQLSCHQGFQTFEGGALVRHDPALKQSIDRFKSFGIVDEMQVESEGSIAKMGELHAAGGLAQLSQIDTALATRRRVIERCGESLADVPGLRCIGEARTRGWKGACFPAMVGPGHRLGRDGLPEVLRAHGVYALRYLHPLVSTLPMYRDLPSARAENLPVATDAANRVLCLPIDPELGAVQPDRLLTVLRDA